MYHVSVVHSGAGENVVVRARVVLMDMMIVEDKTKGEAREKGRNYCGVEQAQS
jgi:hypothetical protein